MTPLEKIIIDKIKKEGSITFETFMEIALYYPEFGYYTSPNLDIGRKGDFYTSPHLHKIFGAMIGRQLEEMWEIMGRPSDFYAVEIGAGAGYLCKDILDYLRNKEIFKSLNYVIVELNPYLQKNQEKLVADFREKIIWVSSLNKIIRSSPPHPPLSKGGMGGKITGCIFSNELLDAFPVHIVEMEDELKEVFVTFNGKELVEEKNKLISQEIANYIKEFSIVLQSGYRTEINLRIRNWLEDITTILSSGFLLTIDYGYSTKEYYDEDRTKGTLLCYHGHQFNENPYQHIGKQDITAHVNFSSLKKWGAELGLKSVGCCPQGTFLTASGIDEAITELYSDSTDYLVEISKIKGLIFPQGMGESHSIMIQYKGTGMPELRGFSMRNLVGSL